MNQILSSEFLYNGKVFDIRVDEIREGDVEYKREIVVHKGSAVIIPVFEDGTVALVRQYRHAAGKYLLEICAGTLNAGENREAYRVLCFAGLSDRKDVCLFGHGAHGDAAKP